MGTAKIRPLTTGRKAVNRDPIPEMYRRYAALSAAGGSMTKGRTRDRAYALLDLAAALEDTILATPAQSLEGAARQLQILASMLQNNALDTHDESGEPTLMGRNLWLAMFGVLHYLLPQFPNVPGEPNYGMAAGNARAPFAEFAQLQQDTAATKSAVAELIEIAWCNEALREHMPMVSK